MVIVQPIIEDPPKSLATPIAKTTRFNCSVADATTTQTVWYKDGRPINFKEGHIHRKDDNQLVIVESITSDTGNFQCLAYNEAGYV